MGHAIEYHEFDISEDKSEICNYCNERAFREGDWEEGTTGLPSPITFLNKVFGSRKEAEAYLETYCDGEFYPEVAVKFHDRNKSSKTLDTLVERRSKLMGKASDLDHKIHCKDMVSAYFSCKKCGSKLAVQYLKSNYCPVCGADLRPATVLNNLKKMKENIKELDKKVEEEVKKLSKTGPEKWLVRIEYHT